MNITDSTYKQERIDNRYIRIALIMSESSYALRRKVGCVIVNGNSIVSDGYNGTPSGFPNVCEYAVDQDGNKHESRNVSNLHNYRKRGMELVTYPYVLHAESNAIAKLTKVGGNAVGATLYVTDEPCIDCAKLIIQAGIKRVVFLRPYRVHEGLSLLHKAGIEIIQHVILPKNEETDC